MAILRNTFHPKSARLLLLLVCTGASLTAAHAQTPLGTVACQSGGAGPLNANVYAFIAEPGISELVFATDQFPTLAAFPSTANFPACVISNGSSSITLGGAQPVESDAFVSGAGVSSAQAESYSEFSLDTNSTTVSLGGNAFPEPFAPIGTLTCSGVQGSLSSPVYELELYGTEDTSATDIFDIVLGPAAYTQLASAQTSAVAYPSCSVTAGPVTVSWSNVSVDYAALEGTGQGVINGAGELLSEGTFEASSQTVTGAKLPGGLSPATTLSCPGVSLSVPAYAWDVSTPSSNSQASDASAMIDADPAELATLAGLAGQSIGTCTLGSGTGQATLSGASVSEITLNGVVAPGSMPEFFTSAQVNFSSITVNGATLSNPSAASPHSLRPHGGRKPTAAERKADAQAKLQRLLAGQTLGRRQ